MRIASLSLLTICCLMLAVAPALAQNNLYDNGPYNGTSDGWTINFGFSVSNSFSVASFSTINDFHFVYWDASSSDLLTSVDIAFGQGSFGGSPTTIGSPTNTFLGTNQFGYSVYQADFTGLNQGWSGPGFVTLSNACSTSGCSVSNPIYWDENSGVGCTGSTCPSLAYENTIGSIPSEAFTLTGFSTGTGGTGTQTTPEPGSIMLFGSGILGLASFLRRKFNR
jgi:hypothetical protein